MNRFAMIVALLASAQIAAAQEQTSTQGGGMAPSFSPVTWERLVNAADEPENWLMYSGTFDSQRYSRLDQIHNRNVSGLELKWAYQIPKLDRAETTPLVVDGVMFITEAPSNVVAVDAATWRQYWRYDHELPDDLRVCCGRNNRGVAILDETLYMSTLDAHLVAIDARSGNLVWNTEVADYAAGYSKTAAPLVVKDQIVTGIAGGEYGILGVLDSYNAATGELEWRTHTIPGPDHPDNQSWAGDSWRTGGSPTWISRGVRPGSEPGLLGHRQPGTGLERRRADGRQSVCRLGARTQRRHRGDGVVLPVHATRHARLGRHSGADSRRPPDGRRHPEGDDVGEPQCLLLHARPGDRRVPGRRAVRAAELGRAARFDRSTDPPSEYGPLDRGNRRVAPGGRRH